MLSRIPNLIFSVAMIAFLVLAFGCNNFGDNNSLSIDPLVKELFEENEIENLIGLLDFVDNQICPNTSNDNKFITCYASYLDKIYRKWKSEQGLRTLAINFEDQLIFQNEMETTTFNKIWRRSINTKSVRIPKGDTIVDSSYTVKSIYVNFEDVLGPFVEGLRIDHPAIDSFQHSASKMGTHSPILFFTEILHNSNQLNLNDPNLRLFVSFFLLQLNNEMAQTLMRNSIIDKEIGELLEKRRELSD